LYALLFGFAGSSLLSFLSDFASAGWVLITDTFLVLFLGSLLFGGMMVWISRKIEPMKKSAIADIQQDMADIESMFKKAGAN
jgi:hypothetical protein